MLITLSTLDRSTVITFPIVPSDLKWTRTTKSNILSTLTRDIDMMENHELRQINISSFFPDNGSVAGKKYSFQKSTTNGRKIISIITKWQDKKTALRLVITANDNRTLVNFAVKIIDFTNGLDRVGDYEYSLTIQEHIPIKGV